MTSDRTVNPKSWYSQSGAYDHKRGKLFLIVYLRSDTGETILNLQPGTPARGVSAPNCLHDSYIDIFFCFLVSFEGRRIRKERFIHLLASYKWGNLNYINLIIRVEATNNYIQKQGDKVKPPFLWETEELLSNKAEFLRTYDISKVNRPRTLECSLSGLMLHRFLKM